MTQTKSVLEFIKCPVDVEVVHDLAENQTNEIADDVWLSLLLW